MRRKLAVYSLVFMSGVCANAQPKPTATLIITNAAVYTVTAATPIFIERYDGHEALANSAAMKLAGIDAKTADVPGGVIVRDATGNPTGIFKDAAMTLMYKAIPPMSREQRIRATRRA